MPDETPIPAELLPPELLVMDLLYTPRETRLMREAAAAGGSVQNGDVLFIEESSVAFHLWTGQAAPLDLVRSTLDATRDSVPDAVAETAEA